MGKRGKVVGIALLGSCLVVAAWAHQAGLFESPAETRIETSRSELSATASNDLQSFAGPPLIRTTQSATTALVNPGARRAPGDIDGDGKSDLLLDRGDLTAYWIMDGAIPVRYSPAFMDAAGYAKVATGDLNGDGKLDIVWARSSDRSLLLWQGDGNGFTALPMRDYAVGWTVTGAGDIDGDGKDDLLLQNHVAGLFAYWLMDGATAVNLTRVFVQPENRRLAAIGDFNGDRRLDIVWEDNRYNIGALTFWIGGESYFVGCSSYCPAIQLPRGWELTGAQDVDGDGKSDLLIADAYDGLFAYWIMDEGFVVRKSADMPQPAAHRQVAVGDYNGDGKVDLVWAREADRTLLLWQGDGMVFTPSAIGSYTREWTVLGVRRPPYSKGDFGGDGRSDLLLLNDGFRKFTTWKMGYCDSSFVLCANTGLGAAPPEQPTGYRLAATGDLNGDREGDLVWVRDSDRSVLVSRFGHGSGLFGVIYKPVRQYAEGWMIRMAGDIDGDGRDDLILQNDALKLTAYWIMDGENVVRYSGVFANPDGFRLVATGTFKPNRKLDLVWVRDADRTVLLWYGDGEGFQYSHNPDLPTTPHYAAGWQVRGTGDVDGNGLSDLILTNSEGVAYWIMSAGNPVRYSPGFLAPAGYTLSATGDYDYFIDGKLDFVWTRPSDGALLLWQGNGLGFTEVSFNGTRVAEGYRIIQP